MEAQACSTSPRLKEEDPEFETSQSRTLFGGVESARKGGREYFSRKRLQLSSAGTL